MVYKLQYLVGLYSDKIVKKILKELSDLQEKNNISPFFGNELLELVLKGNKLRCFQVFITKNTFLYLRDVVLKAINLTISDKPRKKLVLFY